MESPTIAVPERYRVIGVLGSGGMSHVYRAHDSILDKTVAIKILQVESGYGREDDVRRFQLEAKATATLKHDNIVSILDFGLTEDAVPYMVLDHLEGKSLMEIIQGNGPLQLDRALPVLLQVCAGLAHAHKYGVIHRDLKPSNIIFAKDQNGNEVIKVIDFGIARLEENSSLTATNAVIGSPPYMSPEQATGGKIGVTSDIYSLGCVIFETLTGKPPFQGNTSVETIMMHVNEAQPKLSDVVDGDFPASLESFVAKLLEKDPAKRYQSMESVIAAIKEVDSRTAYSVIQPAAKEPGNTRPEFIKGALIVVICVGLVIAAVAGSVVMLEYYLNESDKPSVAGKRVEVKIKPEDQPLLEPTMFLSRTDAFLAKTYRDDTTTTSLQLMHCPITDRGIGYIKHLPLDLMDIRFCTGISDKSLPMIGEIKTLRELHMDNFSHRITPGDSEFKYFENLSLLSHLTIDGVTLSQDDFKALSRIPNLESLHLNRMRNVTKANLLPLRNIKTLKSIELGGEEGGEHHSIEIYEALAQIKTLEKLGLNRSQITDADLPAVAQIKQLKFLNIPRTFVTDKGILYLAKNLPNLEELSVSNCPKITLAGKKAFLKLRPQVELTTDAKLK